jgi:hypothetical protein
MTKDKRTKDGDKLLKNLKFLFVAVLLLAAVNVFAAATDSTYNAAGTVYKTKTTSNYIEYRFTFPATVAGDSVGIHWSKAFAIESYNIGDEPAYFYGLMADDSSGLDCNVSIEYSFDKTTWVAGPLASGVIKDQLTSTAIVDTLNWAGGLPDLSWRLYPWARLKLDYQAGNPIGAITTMRVRIPKDPSFHRRFADIANSL